MKKLNQLLAHAEKENIKIYEYMFQNNLKGLYVDNNIFIHSKLDTTAEKKCILAEELGHHHTAASNILDQENLGNMQLEQRGRAWGYERLVTLESIIEASKEGIRNLYELAEYLNVTEEFLYNSIEYYKSKFGSHVIVDDIIINLSSLEVMQVLAKNESELNKYIENYKNKK